MTVEHDQRRYAVCVVGRLLPILHLVRLQAERWQHRPQLVGRRRARVAATATGCGRSTIQSMYRTDGQLHILKEGVSVDNMTEHWIVNGELRYSGNTFNCNAALDSMSETKQHQLYYRVRGWCAAAMWLGTNYWIYIMYTICHFSLQHAYMPGMLHARYAYINWFQSAHLLKNASTVSVSGLRSFSSLLLILIMPPDSAELVTKKHPRRIVRGRSIWNKYHGEPSCH